MSNEMEITNLTDALAKLNECMFGDNEIPLRLEVKKVTKDRGRLTVYRECEVFDIAYCDGDVAAIFTYPYVYDGKSLRALAQVITHPTIADAITQTVSRHTN